MVKRNFLLCLFVLLVSIVYSTRPAAVHAHAGLETAVPAPDSVLEQSPQEVLLTFSEPLEPEFSEIQVLNAQGERVDNGDSHVVPTNAAALTVTLPPLPQGAYTVAWKNVSSVDGHPLNGSYSFFIGRRSAGAAPPESGAQSRSRSVWEPVLRWLILVSVLAIVGGAVFDTAIVRPALAGTGSITPDERARLGQRLAGRMRTLIWVGVGVFLVASVLQFLMQTAVVNGTAVRESLGGPLLDLLWHTYWGRIWGWRAALALLLIATLPLSGPGRIDAHSILTILLGSGMLLTLSLVSHAAAVPDLQAAALFNDYLHLLATGFWIGGLFHFILVASLAMKALPGAGRRHFLSALVPRFSMLAILSVGTLILTGLYSAYVQVTVLPALQTPYGLTLLIKLALLVPLLLLGAVNLLWVSPRLARESRAGRHLQRTLAAEVTLGVLILLSVGFLISLEPARQVASREGLIPAEPLMLQETAEGATITLTAVPGKVGHNQFMVMLTNRFGEPITNASNVSLSLTYLTDNISPVVARPENGDAGTYIFEAPLNIAGEWQAEVLVVRPDAFDAQATFHFMVASAAGAAPHTLAPSPEVSRLLLGVELSLLGLLFWGTSLPMGAWRSRRGQILIGIGSLAFVSGFVVLISSQV